MAAHDLNRIIEDLKQEAYQKGYDDAIEAILAATRTLRPGKAVSVAIKKEPELAAKPVLAKSAKQPRAKPDAVLNGGINTAVQKINPVGTQRTTSTLLLGFVKENPGLQTRMIVKKLGRQHPHVKEKTIRVYLSRLKGRNQLSLQRGRWHIV